MREYVGERARGRGRGGRRRGVGWGERWRNGQTIEALRCDPLRLFLFLWDASERS